MDAVNQFRRKTILLGIATPVLIFAPSISIAAGLQPIQVDVTGVTDVPGLISAIRKSAGSLLPVSITDDELRAEIAKVFVANVHAAAELGFQIPQWILYKMPQRKVVFPVLGIAIFWIGGIQFAIPVATIITAVLASMAIMAVAVSVAIGAMISSMESKI